MSHNGGRLLFLSFIFTWLNNNLIDLLNFLDSKGSFVWTFSLEMPISLTFETPLAINLLTEFLNNSLVIVFLGKSHFGCISGLGAEEGLAG